MGLSKQPSFTSTALFCKTKRRPGRPFSKGSSHSRMKTQPSPGFGPSSLSPSLYLQKPGPPAFPPLPSPFTSGIYPQSPWRHHSSKYSVMSTSQGAGKTVIEGHSTDLLLFLPAALKYWQHKSPGPASFTGSVSALAKTIFCLSGRKNILLHRECPLLLFS